MSDRTYVTESDDVYAIRTLKALWDTLEAMGGDPDKAGPRQCSQIIPCPSDRVECLKLYLVESLFTGLNTREPDILLRCWPQAHGYAETLAALGHEPGCWLRDRVGELRRRVEDHFLRGR